MVHYNKVNTGNEIISFTAPGSKSETNRVLLLAALGSGKCVIHNPLISDDTLHMIDTFVMEFLNTLKIRIEFQITWQ